VFCISPFRTNGHYIASRQVEQPLLSSGAYLRALAAITPKLGPFPTGTGTETSNCPPTTDNYATIPNASSPKWQWRVRA
jgi:hypothetical protein